jgi:hypothetical protein
LASAVDSNREIWIAIGMTRYQLTRQAAFDMLVLASSHLNRKLRAIAADIPPCRHGPTHIGDTDPTRIRTAAMWAQS